MDFEELDAHEFSNRLLFAQSTTNKSGVAFCNIGCVAKAELYSEDVSTHIRTIKVEENNQACIHCFDCGEIVFEPLLDCALHGAQCPDNIWSLRGYQVIGFMKTWKTVTGGVASDKTLDLAEYIGSNDPDYNFIELVKIVKSQQSN